MGILTSQTVCELLYCWKRMVWHLTDITNVRLPAGPRHLHLFFDYLDAVIQVHFLHSFH